MTDPSGNAVSLAGLSSGVGVATSTASGGLVTVRVAGIEVDMLAARDVSFAVGDPVAFTRVGQVWVAVARTGTGAAPDPPSDIPLPPPTFPATVSGTKVLTPVETRSYLPSGWTGTDQVLQGAYAAQGNATGCAFYGAGPAALAGSVVTAAAVQLRRNAGAGSPGALDTDLWLVTEKIRPGGAPTLTLSVDGPNLTWGEAQSVTVPTAWAQALVDGTAGGLAVFQSDGDPYVVLDGLSAYGASFALTIHYTRTL